MEPQRLYQNGEDIGKIPWAGDERRRSSDRPPKLSDDGQTLLDALERRLKSCRDNCIIPKDGQDNLGHIFGAIKDIGDGSIPRGINRHVDQHKDVGELLSGIKTTKSKVWSVIIYVVVIAILGMLGVGFFQRIGAGK